MPPSVMRVPSAWPTVRATRESDPPAKSFACSGSEVAGGGCGTGVAAIGSEGVAAEGEGLKARGVGLLAGESVEAGGTDVSTGGTALTTLAELGKSKLTAIESVARADLVNPNRVARVNSKKLRRRKVDFMG